nr:hypothetical protein [uncultured Methanoregula sp.]
MSFPQQEAGRIRIDPNLRFLKNEEITLTGTTSLPQDEEIRIHITPPGTGYRGNASTTIPDILAVRGPGNSTWSATVNPLLITSVSTHLYPVTAYAENHPDIRASSNFSVSDTYPLVVGAPYIFSGNVLPGNITAVQVWMLGPSFVKVSTVPVQSDGKFEYILSHRESRDLKFMENSTDYHIIVQYPRSYSLFDLTTDAEQEWIIDTNGKRIFNLTLLRSMKETDSVPYLTGLLNRTGVRDTYRQYDIATEKVWITIDPPGDQVNDHPVIITGSTNLPAGEEVLAHIYKLKIKLLNKGGYCDFCNKDIAQGTIRVTPGHHGVNSLQMLANISGFEPDIYNIRFSPILEPGEAEQTFNITNRAPVTATPSSPSACHSSSACV